MTHVGILASGMRLRRRVITLVAALAMCAALPGAVAADPSPFSCASSRTVFYVMNLPGGYWPSGTNGVEYILTFVDADGNASSYDQVHYFTVAANSPAYRGNVLIRLFSNWGYSADGTVNFDADRILPSQSTSLFVQELFNKGTDVSRDSLLARTERNGQWSDWMGITQGPATSACQPGGNLHWGGLFWRGNGWQ